MAGAVLGVKIVGVQHLFFFFFFSQPREKKQKKNKKNKRVRLGFVGDYCDLSLL
eukprot:SAG11_NODE_1074_length_5968_cov_2.041063_2_plen_54_part_00